MAKLTEEQRQQRAAARAQREALAAEERDRRDAERREMWRCEGMYLSWEEYRSGEPCRGCGEPMQDGLGDWPGLMYLSEQEKREYDAAEEGFRARHADCKGGRWSISGSRVTHCSFCCPPPPMGPNQIKKLRELVASWPSAEERKKDLDAWKLTLTCHHVVERTQHREHSYFGSSVVDCPECSARRGVVHSERIGPAYSDEAIRVERDAADRDRLAEELAAAKSKLQRQRKNAAATQRRVEEIEKQLKQGG
ncbi:hypothetical protein LRS74_14855 [Streptomyces sp. LX-29]|uniref:hypothetical protein n=1 Tax=Streptomyces sp. LX-29 TaxID=2900152 RepID=UPI00240CF1E8|nr:hypothetical protein [Streptomyces sp. LX-29]WFB08188.1 hypothetical protein LRS74_14855 [Streptomyces sp. LX-29]